jgi:spermidine/putrescine transport system permease protein
VSDERRAAVGRLLLAAPLFLWMLGLLVAPLGIVLVYSFLRRGAYGVVVAEPGLENFTRLFDALYGHIYLQSLGLALTATCVCLAVGYPMAYVLARAPRRWAGPLLAMLMLPFLSNFVVRAYAIKVLLSTAGPVNAVIVAVTGAPVMLTDTQVAVWLGMITSYLPFMVLPLYASLARFDFSLLEAAYDLGASDWTAFRRVLLPSTRAGVASGSVLVFVPTLGEFMIPDLLGGARTMLLGNLIAEQFLKARDWPFGAALVVTLVLALALGFALLRLSTPRSEQAR